MNCDACDAMPAFACKEPEAKFIYAAGLAALNIHWKKSVTGLTLISKMNWQMYRAIGYNPKW